MLHVDEVVVVALEDVAVALGPDDPVEDDRVQQAAPVRDDLADVVAALRADDREVAGVEARLHADAVGDDVRRFPAERGGCEEDPRGRKRPQGQGPGDHLLGGERDPHVRGEVGAAGGAGRSL